MVSHCFDLHFLMFTELEHLFKSLLVIYMYFREICLHESLKCIICFSIVDLQIFYIYTCIQNSIQFSSVTQIMSNSLWPHEPQHARPLCPSPTARVYPNPCPLSWWCHPTISSSVVLCSSCPQFFPASGSFPVSQLFASGGQSIGVLASTSVLPMNTEDLSPLGWTQDLYYLVKL